MAEISRRVVALWRILRQLDEEEKAWQKRKDGEKATSSRPSRTLFSSLDLRIGGARTSRWQEETWLEDDNSSLSTNSDFEDSNNNNSLSHAGPAPSSSSPDIHQSRHSRRDYATMSDQSSSASRQGRDRRRPSPKRGPAPAPPSPRDCPSPLPKMVSTSDISPADYQGWLIDQLRGRQVWCAVSDMLFCVFENEDSKVSKQVILLPGCRVRQIEFKSASMEGRVLNGVARHFASKTISGVDKFQFVIEHSVNRQRYMFGVASKTALDQWVSVLDRACTLDVGNEATDEGESESENSKKAEDYGNSGVLDEGSNNDSIIVPPNLNSKQSGIQPKRSISPKSRFRPDTSSSSAQPGYNPAQTLPSRLDVHALSLSLAQPLDVTKDVSIEHIRKRIRKENQDSETKPSPLKATHEVEDGRDTPRSTNSFHDSSSINSNNNNNSSNNSNSNSAHSNSKTSGDNRRRGRSFFKIRSPLDVLLRRKKRSSSADDAQMVNSRRKLFPMMETDTPSFSPRLQDSPRSASSVGSATSNASLETNSVTSSLDSRDSGSVSSSPRKKRGLLSKSTDFDKSSKGLGSSLKRTASDIKEKMFGAQTPTSFESKTKSAGIKLCDLQDVGVSGQLQYRLAFKWVKVWCALSKGCFYAFRSEKSHESPLLAVVLNQCSVTYVAEPAKRQRRLFAFKLSQAQCKSVYICADDHEALIRWMLVLQTEAAKIQVDEELATEIREKRSSQKKREARELLRSSQDHTGTTDDTSLSPQKDKKREGNKRYSCPDFSGFDPKVSPRVSDGSREKSSSSSQKSKTVLSVGDGEGSQEVEKGGRRRVIRTVSDKRVSGQDGGREGESGTGAMSSSGQSSEVIKKSSKSKHNNKSDEIRTLNGFEIRTDLSHLLVASRKTGDSKGKGVSSERKGVSSKGESVYSKGESVSSKGESVYSKGESVYNKGESVYSKGESVYSKGESVYTKGESVYSKGESVYSKGESVYSKGENVSNKRTSKYYAWDEDDDDEEEGAGTTSPSLSRDPEDSATRHGGVYPVRSKTDDDFSVTTRPLPSKDGTPSPMTSFFTDDGGEDSYKDLDSSGKQAFVHSGGMSKEKSSELSFRNDFEKENDFEEEDDFEKESSFQTPQSSNRDLLRYEIESSVHDDAVKEAWSTNEDFLLAVIKDKLRRRRQREPEGVDNDVTNRISEENGDYYVIQDSWESTELSRKPERNISDPPGVEGEKGEGQEEGEESGEGGESSHHSLVRNEEGEPETEEGENESLSSIMEGFVEKRGVSEHWNRYWCVLRDVCLYSYLKPHDQVPSDVTELRGYTAAQLIDKIQGKRFVLSLEHTNYIPVFLSLDSREELSAWHDSIQMTLTQFHEGPEDVFAEPGATVGGDKACGRPAVQSVKQKLLAEMLRQKLELEKIQAARNGLKAESAQRLENRAAASSAAPGLSSSSSSSSPSSSSHPRPASTLWSSVAAAARSGHVASEDDRVCTLTRLRQRRMSTQIKINAIQREMDASTSHSKERKNVFQRNRKRPDLVQGHTESECRRPELEEQVKSLSSRLQELDTRITSHGAAGPRDAEMSDLMASQHTTWGVTAGGGGGGRGGGGGVGKSWSEEGHDCDSDRDRDSDKEKGGGKSSSLKFSVQKFAHRTFAKANWNWYKKSAGQSEDQDSNNSTNSSSSSRTKVLFAHSKSEPPPDVIDMTSNNNNNQSNRKLVHSSIDTSDIYAPPDSFKTDYSALSLTLPNPKKSGTARTPKERILSKISSSHSFTHLERFSSRLKSSSSSPSLDKLASEPDKDKTDDLSLARVDGLALGAGLSNGDLVESRVSGTCSAPSSARGGAKSPRSSGLLSSPRREVNPNALAEIQAFEELSLKFLESSNNTR